MIEGQDVLAFYTVSAVELSNQEFTIGFKSYLSSIIGNGLLCCQYFHGLIFSNIIGRLSDKFAYFPQEAVILVKMATSMPALPGFPWKPHRYV